MKKIIFSFFALMINASIIAQVRTITGKVVDEKGDAVPFASVKVKNSKVGTAADANGYFNLRANTGTTLDISSSGYSKNEATVGQDNNLTITIKKVSNELTAVVVTTALGQTQNKSKIGYSASTFSTDAINRDAPVSLLDGLSGKVAGADISQIGGPGASTKVVLRGYGNIAGANNQPLYVVDGVPLSNAQFESANGNTDFGDGLGGVNPNDVQSITILKGTAASSLYGGAAKNGAVMITTKKGRAGKLKIEFNSSANFSQVGKLSEYQSEFGSGWGGLAVPDENGSWGPRLDGKERLWGSVVNNSQLEKPFSFIHNNLRDFYTIGSEYNNTLALSGGGDITQFYFSYGNVSSDGIVPTKSDYLLRNTFALRTNSNFGKFTINTSFNYVNQGVNVPNTGQNNSTGGGVFQSVLQIPVDVPIKDFANYKNQFFNINNYFTPYAENPYYGLNENGDKQNQDRFFGNVDLSYNFTSHLSGQVRIGGDFTDARTLSWTNTAAADAGTWNAGANPEGSNKTPDVGSVTQASDYFGIINGDAIIKYNNDINKDLNVTALAGVNYYQTSQRSESAGITNLVVPGFYNLSNTSLPPLVTDNLFNRKRIGAYGQVTLGYKEQLYVTGNVRNDWSSTLPIENNSIFYPGVNVSWLPLQTFNSHSSSISYWQIRGAYGKTGSDPEPYQVAPRLGSGNTNLLVGSLTFPFNGVSGFGINNTIGNPQLKPIFTTETELGTEIKFFHNRIDLDAAVYDKKTVGQIFPVEIAPSTGYSNLVENIGTVRNKGIEITFGAIPVQGKDFTWSINYTFTKNWNNVEQLTGSQDPLLSSEYNAELRAVVGKTVASIYEIVPQLSPGGQIVVNPQTGLPIANQTPLDANGLTKGYFGTALYNYTMGLVNTFKYKNFSLNFSLDLREGGLMYSETADLVLFDGNGAATTYNDRKPFIIPNSVNAVTGPNGKANYVPNTSYIGQGNITPGGSLNETDNTYQYYYPSQDPGAADAMRIISRSFLKLRDITLSYSLPHKIASKIGALNATVSIYGRNFLLWTPSNNIYVDPEATNLGNDLSGELGEFNSTPLSHQLGAALKIIF